jgi:hypothetical protein
LDTLNSGTSESGKHRAHVGSVIFMAAAGIGAILVALGLIRTDLHLDELWPIGTLANFLGVASLYVCGALFIRLIPSLRMKIRGFAFGALLLLLGCGAGLGGLAATILLLVSSLALGDLVTRDSADRRQNASAAGGESRADGKAWADGLVAVVVGLGLWSVVV